MITYTRGEFNDFKNLDLKSIGSLINITSSLFLNFFLLNQLQFGYHLLFEKSLFSIL